MAVVKMNLVYKTLMHVAILFLLCSISPCSPTQSCHIDQQKVNTTDGFFGPIVHLSVDPVTDAEVTLGIDPSFFRNTTINFIVFEKIIFESLVKGRSCLGKESLAKEVYPLNANSSMCSVMGGGSLVCHIQVEHDEGPENEIYYCALSNCIDGRIELTYTFDIIESPYVAECDHLSTKTVIMGTILMLLGALALGGLVMYMLKKT